MAESSFTYCDIDEEIFIGKVTEKELRKRALLGIVDSPEPVSSTPRPKTAYVQSTLASNLPDVLNSSSMDKSNEPPIRDLENQSALPKKSFNDEDSDVILINSTANDSVQIISDDDSFLKNGDSFTDVESFIRNEELCKSSAIDGSVSQIDKSVYAHPLPPESRIELYNNKESASCFSDKEKIKSDFAVDTESFHSQNGHQMTHISSNVDLKIFGVESVIQNEELCKSNTIDSRTGSKSDVSVYCDARPTEISELDYGSFFSDRENTDSDMFTADNEVTDSERSNLSSSKIPEVRATEKFIFENSQQCTNKNKPSNNVFTTSLTQNVYNSVEHSENAMNTSPEEDGQIELTTDNNETKTAVDILINTPMHNIQIAVPSAQRSGLRDLDYSSIYAVSDSILNISHGSSLPSPLSQHEVSKETTQSIAMTYEDVSCDGEQLLNMEVKNAPSQTVEVDDDFHMSVDDPAIVHNSSLGNAGTSTNSSYTTAFDSTSKPSSNQFSMYRNSFNDSKLEDNYKDPADLELDRENETSFEMVMQNRQNSFSAEPSSKKSENILETNKISKLPIFKSLIKPPVLNVRPENLLTSNYKWAKNLPNSDVNKKTNQLKNNFTSKLPCANTGNKALLNLPTDSKTPYKIKDPNISAKSKTPSFSKTPTLALPAPQRVVKSDSKTLNVMKPPVKNILSHDKKLVKTPTLLAPTRDRYKNIISPVRSYIKGATVALQEHAQVPREGICSSKKKQTHIPKRATPLKDKENTPQTKSSKIVQRLNYLKAVGQENVAPACSRDTLPPRVLEAASAVFIKEDNQPKKVLPKVGETMQKLLKDTPRPKITVHQGRVRESPKTKGQLFTNGSADGNADISVRLVRNAEYD